MIETWVIITILACFLQNLRSLFQKKLQGTLSNLGATYTRFGYGLPFVLLYIIALFFYFDFSINNLTPTFLLYCFIGGITQIIATYILLKTYLLRNFAVSTAYSKTEPIQAVFFGIIILNEKINIMGFLAIILAVIGVLLVSIEKKINFNRGALLGILSGTLFGVSAVCFRGASLELDYINPLISSTVTLVAAITMQTIVFSIFILYKEPEQISLSFSKLKYSLIVGFTGASASMCWFYCMAIQNVAYVRALGQVELIFSLMISFFYLKEKVRSNELLGLILMLTGIILIILFS